MLWAGDASRHGRNIALCTALLLLLLASEVLDGAHRGGQLQGID
jgi:hypothetical protein